MESVESNNGANSHAAEQEPHVDVFWQAVEEYDFDKIQELRS